MFEIKVKNQGRAIRCEVCHQSDCYDQYMNTCSRCETVSLLVLQNQNIQYENSQSKTPRFFVQLCTIGLWHMRKLGIWVWDHMSSVILLLFYGVSSVVLAMSTVILISAYPQLHSDWWYFMVIVLAFVSSIFTAGKFITESRRLINPKY